MQVKPDPSTSGDMPRPPTNEGCDVNIDYIQAFEEGKATLPVKPDILILPSDLKPFIKVIIPGASLFTVQRYSIT